MVLNYGLKYEDLRPAPGHRPHHQVGPADPRDPQADPLPQPRPRRPGRRHHPRIRRLQPPGDREGAVPQGVRQRPIRELRRPRRRNGQDPFPLRRPAPQVGQTRHRLLHDHRRHQGADRAGERPAAASRRRTSTRTSTSRLNTCKLRFGERLVDSRPGSFSIEETQLSQITLQVHSIDQVRPSAPIIKDAIEPKHPKKDVDVRDPLRPADAGAGHGPRSSASSSGRSRRSRCWSAGSGS